MYLKNDPEIKDQLWCCLSFIPFETFDAIKIRGLYATFEEAQERANYLLKQDPNFNIFIGEVGKWLQSNFDPDTILHYKYNLPDLEKNKNYLKK